MRVSKYVVHVFFFFHSFIHSINLFCRYGDMTPLSIVGRLTGIICSLSGIMVVALPAPVLEKNFNRKKEEGRPDPDERKKKHDRSSTASCKST